MWCFYYVVFEMCFAPQRRPLFQHLNFQKVFRRWRIFSILTSTCASRHNGVQFFIAHQTRWLRTRRFSEPTFLPYRATEHGKNTVTHCFATFYLFVRLQLLSSDSFSSSIFFLLPVSSLTPLPTSAFSSVHIVRSLPSKLPAISIGISKGIMLCFIQGGCKISSDGSEVVSPQYFPWKRQWTHEPQENR